MLLAWIFPVMLAQRLAELLLSRRNRRLLGARGALEFHPHSFRSIIALHSGFILSLALESHPWVVPLNSLTGACLVSLLLLQAVRYWCMYSLGTCWNTRIILVPGGSAVRSGPYRFLRHPNYLVVILEFFFLPLLMRAPVTLAIFFTANLLVLRQRIRLEEDALSRFTDYTARFTGGAVRHLQN